ncbi:uncharacterized protein [Montipora foliosa]|uniref:uncharacterized protein n=1 Tax=Montipora foliosa TaxID=591990 RepID=UPI0035F11357
MASQLTNRRFFPSKATIRNHIYKSGTKDRFSKIDQEDLLKKMELWKEASPDNSFEFHPYATYAIEEESPRRTDDGGDGQNDSKGDEQIVRTSTKGFLFVHQTRDQKRLLERYGNEICMLDATYKTTRYSLPLFRDVVKTNVDYQIVGSFVVQSETADAIFEALMVLKSWNPKWKPPCLMVDYSGEQMSAIERLYAVIRLQKTLGPQDFGFRPDNADDEVTEYDSSSDQEETETDVSELERVHFLVRNDCADKQLTSKWVWAFRKDRFLTTTNTNNGVKRQNKAFKYDYLEGHNHATLSRRLTVVVEDFLPNKYVELNTKLQASFRRYNPSIPPYLRERPHHIIKHCMERHALAESMPSSHVEVIEIANDVFARQRMPCKHFFAVFLHVPAWSFDRPPKPYRDSPFLR